MDPRYPAGKFENPKEVTPAARKAAIEEIASAPTKVRAAVHGLNDSHRTAKGAGRCARWSITWPTAI